MLAPVPASRIDRLLEAPDVTLGEPLTAPIRRFRPTGGLTGSEAIEDDRAER